MRATSTPAELAAQITARPSREDLVRILLDDDVTAADCARRVGTAAGWAAVFGVADTWSVIPNLRTRLHELRIDLPTTARQALFDRFQRAFTSTTLQARRGVQMCRALEERGTPVVVFKGLAAIAHLYAGSTSGRVIKDVDLLVRPVDLIPALDALRAMGMRLEDGGSLDDYLSFVRNSPGFGGNEAITVRGDGQPDIDLHWRFGARTHVDFQADAILARAVRSTVFDTPIRVVDPADGLMLSAHHSVRETFAPDQMLRDVLDTGRWLTMLQAGGRLSEALGRARACGLDVPVTALCEILARRSQRPRVTTKDVRADRLADLFELQVREGSIAKDFTYLTDRHAIGQVLSGLAGGWRRYRLQMAAFERQLSGQSMPLRARMTARLRQLRHLDLDRWRMLRTLSRARSRYQHQR